jgi:hypothetical protein
MFASKEEFINRIALSCIISHQMRPHREACCCPGAEEICDEGYHEQGIPTSFAIRLSQRLPDEFDYLD